MPSFDPASYGPAVARLLVDRRLAELGPGRPNVSARAGLQRLTHRDLVGDRPVVDGRMLDACRAGLWLYHDFLDESHTLSQSIETSSGSYWHGIMHRREPDYGNSKYWFRQVGEHAIFPRLATAASEFLRARPEMAALLRPAAVRRSAEWLLEGAAWDPFRFVDLCETAATNTPDLAPLCRELALVEWEFLFDYCYHQGVGATE